MKFLISFIIILCLIAGCFFYFFKVIENGDTSPVVLLPDPPVALNFRDSHFWPGSVARITNLHSSPIQITLHVVNEKAEREVGDWDIVIPVGETKEIGVLEVGWHFDPGERGYIKVRGYTKRLRFKLFSDGKYKTWFDL